MALNQVPTKIYEKMVKQLPPAMAGRIDWARPKFLRALGGPLNGQVERQQIVRDLARAIEFDLVVETGTFRGTSTEFFAHVTGAPVETVEATGRYFSYASLRFASLPDVTVNQSDSREFLRTLASQSRRGTTFFYLDAHWHDDLPLAEELVIIGGSWTDTVVMIDDFEVPDDSGYDFDDYGPGKKLTASYLPNLDGWGTYYPSAPATRETGARRGCVVLASPSLCSTLDALPSLRTIE